MSEFQNKVKIQKIYSKRQRQGNKVSITPWKIRTVGLSNLIKIFSNYFYTHLMEHIPEKKRRSLPSRRPRRRS